MHSPHRIDEFVIDLSFASAATARARQNDLNRWLVEQLLPAVDELFDRHGGDTPILLDRVEIDLGSVAAETCRAEIAQRLVARLGAVLRRAAEQAAGSRRGLGDGAESKAGRNSGRSDNTTSPGDGPDSATPAAGPPAAGSPAALGSLIEALRHDEALPAQTLEQALRAGREHWLAILQDDRLRPLLLQRLLRRIDEDQRVRVLRHLAPTHVECMLHLLDALQLPSSGYAMQVEPDRVWLQFFEAAGRQDLARATPRAVWQIIVGDLAAAYRQEPVRVSATFVRAVSRLQTRSAHSATSPALSMLAGTLVDLSRALRNEHGTAGPAAESSAVARPNSTRTDIARYANIDPASVDPDQLVDLCRRLQNGSLSLRDIAPDRDLDRRLIDAFIASSPQPSAAAGGEFRDAMDSFAARAVDPTRYPRRILQRLLRQEPIDLEALAAAPDGESDDIGLPLSPDETQNSTHDLSSSGESPAADFAATSIRSPTQRRAAEALELRHAPNALADEANNDPAHPGIDEPPRSLAHAGEAQRPALASTATDPDMPSNAASAPSWENLSAHAADDSRTLRSRLAEALLDADAERIEALLSFLRENGSALLRQTVRQSLTRPEVRRHLMKRLPVEGLLDVLDAREPRAAAMLRQLRPHAERLRQLETPQAPTDADGWLRRTWKHSVDVLMYPAEGDFDAERHLNRLIRRHAGADRALRERLQRVWRGIVFGRDAASANSEAEAGAAMASHPANGAAAGQAANRPFAAPGIRYDGQEHFPSVDERGAAAPLAGEPLRPFPTPPASGRETAAPSVVARLSGPPEPARMAGHAAGRADELTPAERAILRQLQSGALRPSELRLDERRLKHLLTRLILLGEGVAAEYRTGLVDAVERFASSLNAAGLYYATLLSRLARGEALDLEAAASACMLEEDNEPDQASAASNGPVIPYEASATAVAGGEADAFAKPDRGRDRHAEREDTPAASGATRLDPSLGMQAPMPPGDRGFEAEASTAAVAVGQPGQSPLASAALADRSPTPGAADVVQGSQKSGDAAARSTPISRRDGDRDPLAQNGRPTPLGLRYRLAQALLRADTECIDDYWPLLLRDEHALLRQAVRHYLVRPEVRQQLMARFPLPRLMDLLEAYEPGAAGLLNQLQPHAELLRRLEAPPQPADAESWLRRAWELSFDELLRHPETEFDRARHAERLIRRHAGGERSTQEGLRRVWGTILHPHGDLATPDVATPDIATPDISSRTSTGNINSSGRPGGQADIALAPAVFSRQAGPRTVSADDEEDGIERRASAGRVTTTPSLSVTGESAPADTIDWQGEVERFIEGDAELKADARRDLGSAIADYASRARHQAAFYRHVLRRLVQRELIDLEAILTLSETEELDTRGPIAPNTANKAGAQASSPTSPMAEASALIDRLQDEIYAHPASNGSHPVDLAPLLQRLLDDPAQGSKAAVKTLLEQAEFATRLAGRVSEQGLRDLLARFRPSTQEALLRSAAIVGDAVRLLERDDATDRLDRCRRGFMLRTLLIENQTIPLDRFTRALTDELVRGCEIADARAAHALVQRRLALLLPESREPAAEETRQNTHEAAHNRALDTLFDSGASTPDTTIEGIVVENAGLVLVAPFLPRLFALLQLTADGRFADWEAIERAARLLHFLVWGEADVPLHDAALDKILCGVGNAIPMHRSMPLADTERHVAEQLLNGAIANWSVVGKTSIKGLRETFLQRRGWLSLHEGAWRLTVTPGPFDMLLDRLPWSFSIIKYPWMDKPMHVIWR